MDGVGMTAHNYAYWLNEKFGKTALVAPKVKGYEDEVDYRVFRFKSVLIPGMNPYRVGLPLIDVTFKKKIKRVKFDLLHAHSPFISGQLAQKLARQLGVPLVATFHTKYKEDFKKVLNNDLFVDFLMHMTLDFYQSADVVWVPNRSTGNTLREYGYEGKFDIIPNGTDMEIIDPVRKLKFRKKGLEMTGFDANDFILLFVGQHRWEKNVKMILDALKILKMRKKSCKMVFVGEGYAAKEMKKIAYQSGLKDRVKFLGPIIDRKELRYIYALADLFVFPSLYDNSPLVIQEAAAFDVPSIVVRDSSSSEGITDKVNGFLIADDAGQLSSVIGELMSYPEVIRLAGEGARKSLYKPWESIVDEVYTRYQEIILDHQPKYSKQSDDDEE
jgi:glycosyltransferase involved in cell wall biosynthesis